jgi:hypothetical protein
MTSVICVVSEACVEISGGSVFPVQDGRSIEKSNIKAITEIYFFIMTPLRQKLPEDYGELFVHLP